MNRLLRESFLHKGYDYDYLTDVYRDAYRPGYLFPDEDRLILALKQIRDRGARLVVCPDFDMDGISAGCIFYAGLSLLGFRVSLFAPDITQGYGIRASDIDRVRAEFPDAAAILTCDVGIGAEEAAARARDLGMTFLVTDHHPETRRTSAAVIVDPSRMDSGVPFRDVCGAWVALHVVRTYAALTGNEAVISLVEKLTLFAGLGSRGDIMPVVHDTRSVVRRSVELTNFLLDCEDLSGFFECQTELLPDAYFAPFDNFRYLHYFLLRSGKIQAGDVTEETYDFKYCPLFNSLKRMDGDIRKLYALLYTRFSRDRNPERDALCQWLTDLNDERKKLIGDLFEKLSEDSSQIMAPYIYTVDARPGLLGPLAAKFLDRTGKPCLVLRPDGRNGFSGSGRTPQGFFRTKNGVFDFPGVRADGHENAFGVSVPARQLRNVFHAMERISAVFRPGAGYTGDLMRDYYVVGINGRDCLGGYHFSVCRPDDFDECFDYAHEIEKFRPFGRGLEEPEFCLAFTPGDIIGTRLMGADGSHLRLTLDHGITAVWFGGAEFVNRIPGGSVFRLAGKFRINRFNGGEYLQFLVSKEIC